MIIFQNIISNEIWKLRIEGFSTFFQRIKKSKPISFDYSLFESWLENMEKVSSVSKDTNEVIKVLKELHYKIGPIMVAIIVINHLINSNLKYSAWVSAGKDYNATYYMGKFWPKSKFELKFTNDEETLRELSIIMDK